MDKQSAQYLALLQAKHQFDLLKFRAAFQANYRTEIDRIASALRADQGLCGVDSSRWRCKPDPVFLKVAEEIVSAFQSIGSFRSKDVSLRRAEQLRDTYTKIVRILQKGRAHDHLELMTKEARSWGQFVANVKASALHKHDT